MPKLWWKLLRHVVRRTSTTLMTQSDSSLLVVLLYGMWKHSIVNYVAFTFSFQARKARESCFSRNLPKDSTKYALWRTSRPDIINVIHRSDSKWVCWDVHLAVRALARYVERPVVLHKQDITKLPKKVSELVEGHGYLIFCCMLVPAIEKNWRHWAANSQCSNQDSYYSVPTRTTAERDSAKPGGILCRLPSLKPARKDAHLTWSGLRHGRQHGSGPPALRRVKTIFFIMMPYVLWSQSLHYQQ